MERSLVLVKPDAMQRDLAGVIIGRLQKEGLNPVDQLVGSFGPAMEVYSRDEQGPPEYNG